MRQKQINWKYLLYPSKVIHALRIESFTIKTILQHGFPHVILQELLGGLGDELLLTCVAHELKKRHESVKIWRVSSAAEILLHNPDYHRVFSMDYWPLHHSNILNSKRVKLSYHIIPKEHILAILCRRAGITETVALRTYCKLLDNEKKAGRLAACQVVVQSVGLYAYQNANKNKMWFHDRFQKVVNKILSLYPDIKIIQLGVSGDPPLQDVIDLRGKTTLRESAAILSQAECCITTIGFLSHLARAVDCRSVIICGGHEHSWQSGYVCNENLETYPQCAPCWRCHHCDNNRICMDMITVEDVFAAFQRILSKKGTPLETQEVNL